MGKGYCERKSVKITKLYIKFNYTQKGGLPKYEKSPGWDVKLKMILIFVDVFVSDGAIVLCFLDQLVTSLQRMKFCSLVFKQTVTCHILVISHPQLNSVKDISPPDGIHIIKDIIPLDGTHVIILNWNYYCCFN